MRLFLKDGKLHYPGGVRNQSINASSFPSRSFVLVTFVHCHSGSLIPSNRLAKQSVANVFFISKKGQYADESWKCTCKGQSMDSEVLTFKY